MEGHIEVIRIPLSDEENLAILNQFKDFYKTNKDLSIKKEIFVTKDSFKKALNHRLRTKSPFEPADPIESTKSSSNKGELSIFSSKISFIFPSNRTITLAETLTAPDGLPERVELTDSDGNNLTFESYLHAEAEVASRLLSEEVLNERS